MRLELTPPPSTNKLYTNVRGVGRVKTAAYKAWIKGAMMELVAQRAKPVTPPVSLALFLPETIRGDISNRCKAIEDLLVRAEIIPDDNKKIVRSISITFHDAPGMVVEVNSVGDGQ